MRHARSTLAAAVMIATLQVCTASAPAEPIPEGPEAGTVRDFIGWRTPPRPVRSAPIPQHPFMAPNGRSNLHSDAYQSDTHAPAGPLGRGTETLSTLQVAECASLTFDSADRIVAICVGLDGPRLVLFTPDTLEVLTTMPLPPRSGGSGGDPLADFSGGGYFYLDNQDRAVTPTNHRHIWVVGQTSTPAGPGFALERDYDLSLTVPPGDAIISVLPDWSGRIWFVSVRGIVGTVEPVSGAIKILNLGEPIGNSFAVDETGGAFIVTDRALYRFDALPDGTPSVTWDEAYDNIGVRKPGQTQAGSGTTPTLTTTGYVAITDNADPMKVLVYRREPVVSGDRLVCAHPVFRAGAGSTDQSLIGIDRSFVVENNYGYTGITSTMNGVTTEPGLERVDVEADGSGCGTAWRNRRLSAPSVVPKLSLGAGLVYTYTKPQDRNGEVDSWYFTAISFRTGQTVYKRLAGTGFGFNNNFAPVTVGPDRTAYVGALGGLVLFRDQ